MTTSDQLQLLRDNVAELGQGVVAKRIGYASSTISQILSGSYAGNPDKVLQKVEEVFGNSTVHCPYFGYPISLADCAKHRNRPFAATNPQRVQLYRECNRCPHNGGKS
ncbi:helix-turn-helix transcriptional regulator [uncultured Desulfuromusa sp.]|uniref:helix-turn-helix domain-containing protein n=1 Tax=uncultured Desulfuromusa sp. TaxID=219183 RepID=UPI002AA8FFAF|nr:helix-turn-helix transcriptional regulator [uncultured Desulfuromusa sp.]